MTKGLMLGGVVYAVTLAACAGSPEPAEEARASVLTILERSSGDARGVELPSLTPFPRDPIVKAELESATPAFYVRARTPALRKAPCSGCHTVPLPAMRWTGEDGRKQAHWAIELEHASERVMACGTCHTPDALENLHTLEGQAVSFDHAYQLCAQCHAGQADDWVGGAHGKRAGGWAPPRVVFSCPECHDPHRPAIESRWPARAGRATP